MASAFIEQFFDIDAFSYPGYLAGCRFSLVNYRDDDFDRQGIVLPPAMRQAVDKRKADYLAGRVLCRRLLQKAGIASAGVAIGADGTPCWPAGVAGSLSHSQGVAVCALSAGQGVRAVGIDVQEIVTAQTAENVLPLIVEHGEWACLQTMGNVAGDGGAAGRPGMGLSRRQCLEKADPHRVLFTLAFSAKESLFKALYPLVKSRFHFLDARLLYLDTSRQLFTLKLLKTLNSELTAGREFSGYYCYLPKAVVTFIYL